MNFMEAKTLWDLGYEEDVNNNITKDVKEILLDDYAEEILKGIAYELDSEFYFSIMFIDNEDAYSVVKIDGDIYEKYLETEEDIESAIEHSYVCDDVAIFKLKDEVLECIGY